MGASSSAAYLDNLTVIDLASVGAAARASRILADYGARVIKVAPVAGKRGKQIEPPFYSYGAGRGMKRLRVDLRAEAGKQAFLCLAARADVIIESFRPGVSARLGIGYDDLRAINPRIIFCATSGYGQDGPYSQWAGHDLNYLALGGFLHCSGRRADGGPAIPGATVADSAAGGMHAVIAILAALAHRASSGEGEYLDVSVADGVVQLMSLHIDRYLATGEEPGPGGDILTGRYACYDVYRAGDGKWLSVAAIEPRFFANLCKGLGCERWIEHQLDDTRQDDIRADLAAAFGRRDRDEWVALLAPDNACVAPVYTIAELSEDPHLVGRGVFVEAEQPELASKPGQASASPRRKFGQLGPVLAGGRRQPLYRVEGEGHTDTDELLREAGLSDAELARLRCDGVVE